MSSETAIKVSNLSKCYQIYDTPRDRLKQVVMPRMQRLLGKKPKQYFREFWALKDVSFEVKKGETVGIIGRNGSGKSTLLQIICGTLRPSAGSVQTNGRVAALLELGSGFNPEFTGRENVYLNGAVLGLSKEEIDARFDDIASFADIGDFIERPVKTYSSGMYARLAFSVAIHVDPEILIVDEALAVGDTRFVAKSMRRIDEIQHRGASILFVSHDVGSVRSLCKRAVWLDKGRVIEDGDVLPVTGKFMEFLFKDEPSDDQHLCEDILKNNELAIEAVDTDANIAPKLVRSSENGNEYETKTRPVTHWGSRKGLILRAYVRDERGFRSDIIAWGRPFEVIIEVAIPHDITRENLSIAFSIKDASGNDFIVSTTSDHGRLALPNKERFRVCFRMINYLNTGKFILVAAVEKRLGMDVHYYEYLEGAHYFSSLAERRFFGIFQPVVQQSVCEMNINV